MQEVLLQKIHSHLKVYHPELVLQLQEVGRLRLYLQEAILPYDGLLSELLAANTSPGFAEEQCFKQWRETLPPSKYDYLEDLLEAEFNGESAALQESGLLTTELINLITYCDPVFEALGFDEEDRYLRYHLIGTVSEYLENVSEAKEV